MGKLTKSLVLGGLIAGALVAFSKTKKGQALQKKLTSQAEDLFENVENRLQKVKNITKDKYEDAVDAVVKLYAKNKGLTAQAATKIAKELKARWKEVQLSMLYAEVKTELDDLAEVSKKNFDVAVDELVKTYQSGKRLTKAEAAAASKELKKKWGEFKEEIA